VDRLQPTHSANEQQPEESSAGPELRLDGVVLSASRVANSRMLPHVRMIVRLVEGIQLSLPELVSLLQQAIRQHSIARRSRTDYVLDFLHRHPP
jgi:hypothetical protein